MYRRHYLAFVIMGLLSIPLIAIAQGADGEEKPEAAKSDEGAGAEAKEGDAKSEEKKDAKAEGDQSKEEAKPAAAAPPPPTAKPEASATPKGTYTVRLRDLEDRINRLKEQIFRSKARLSLLAETVLDRKIAGSKATILFRNEMGGSFRLVKATFLLDGGPIFNKADEGGSLAERDVINLYDGPVMPGDHTLSAVLHYRGHGYGIFSYLRGYSFKTRSSRTFTVNEGKAMKLEVVGYEKGGVTTPLEDRPDIRYIMGVAEFEGESLDDEEEEKD